MIFDISNVGKRETVDELRASELLKPLLESTEMVESICLSNKSYTRASSAIVATHLAEVAKAGRFEHLKTVDIADVIAGRPEDEALEVLRTLCAPFAGLQNITTIDVSDNAFGAKGLDASAILLEGRSKLISLKACNNGISEASTKQLCDLVLANGCELKTFHFFNNMSGPGGAKEIAAMLRDPKLAGLQNLRFSGTRARAEGTLAVINSIAEGNHHFIRLDLNDNTFQETGALRIASALTSGRFSNLNTLLLRDGSLGAIGVTTVCKAIAIAKPPLIELDLSGNEIGEAEGKTKAAKALSKALTSIKNTLKVFLIEDNELGSKMMIGMTNALSKCKDLIRLQLCNNDIRGKAMLELVKVLTTSQGMTLMKSSGGLEINGNYLTDEHVESLQGLLSQVSAEACLGSLDDNNEDEEDQEEDEEDESEEEEEEEEEEVADEEGGAVDSLVNSLSSLAVDTSEGTQDASALKKAVGYLAVDTYVKSNMRVGLGTGSTATFVVERLGAKLKNGGLNGCIGYPTSQKTLEQAQSLGIPIGSIDELAAAHEKLDVCIDGADSVDSAKQLVKGGGGALLREKMVAMSSSQLIIVADASKRCDHIGPHFMLPIEIVPFSYKRTMQLIEALPSIITAKGETILRLGSSSNNKVDGSDPAITDNGNYIVDVKFQSGVVDPRALAKEVNAVVGVVEHGLFIDMATTVLIAEQNGSITTL